MKSKKTIIGLFMSLCVVQFLCLWTTHYFLPILSLIGLFIVVKSWRGNPASFKVTDFQIVFLGAGIFGIFNYHFSLYRPNTKLFVFELITFVVYLFIFNYCTRSFRYKFYSVLFLNITACLFAFGGVINFLIQLFQAQFRGFEDFSQVRFLFTPMGVLSNEWVTIMLCFLSLPIIGMIFLYKNHLFSKSIRKLGNILFVLTTLLIICNILITFSRAGYITLILFFVLTNIAFVTIRYLSIRKMILLNFATILLFGGFYMMYSKTLTTTIYQSVSHRRSTESRIAQLEKSYNLFKNHKAWGIGAKNYALINISDQAKSINPSFTGRVNNSFVQLLIEHGIIGTIPYIVLLCCFFFSLWRNIKAAKHKRQKALLYLLGISIISILIREMMFSALFYNAGIILLLITLMTLFIDYRQVTLSANFLKYFSYFLVFMLCIISYLYIKDLLDKPNDAVSCSVIAWKKSDAVQVEFDYSLMNNDKNVNLIESIELYKKAIQKNPHDALFYHNLSWLYSFDNRQDSALYYIRKALNINPNEAAYYISYGMQTKNMADFFKAYQQAVILEPAIIFSSFYKDFSVRYPELSEQLPHIVLNFLKSKQHEHYNSITDAKIGVLLLAVGNLNEAYECLYNVTEQLPNLSRPWCYLGILQMIRGNGESAEISFKKSIFLNMNDHLPKYALAYYYRKNGNKKLSDSFIRSASAIKIRSNHSIRCKRIYYKQTIDNDMLPTNLLDYISPNFDLLISNNQ